MDHESDEAQIVRKLESHGVRDPIHTGQGLATALGLPGTLTSLDPFAQRDRIWKLVRRLCTALAQRRPVLMVVENIHLLDEQSLVLLKEWTHTRHPWPVLVTTTGRPDDARVSAMGSGDNVAEIRLGELDHTSRRELIVQRFEQGESVEALADAVIEGLDEERFLILPHPQVGQFESYKAARRDEWLSSMRAMQRDLGYVSTGAIAATKLSGPVTPGMLMAYEAWRQAADAALEEDSGALDDVPPGAQIEVILGAWCPDCVRELTRMWHAFDGRPFDVRYVAVDVARDAGGAPHADFDALPTIVVRRDGEEVGRIVESSPNGVERDLGALLRGEVTGVLSATLLG